MDVVVEGSCLGLVVFRAIWFESTGRIRHGHGNGIGRFTNSDRKDIEELVSELRNGGYLGFAVPYSGSHRLCLCWLCCMNRKLGVLLALQFTPYGRTPAISRITFIGYA